MCQLLSYRLLCVGSVKLEFVRINELTSAYGDKTEECNYDNTMDDSLIDNKLGILRDNQSLYFEDSFKHKYNSNDGHIVNTHNRINGGTTVKRHQISSVQDSEKGIRHPCNQCDRRFGSKSKLNDHIKVAHEGIKYPCNQCDRLYTSRFHLNEHLRANHKGVKFTCDLCNKEFAYKVGLDEHNKNIHE
ncbi:uncharacterized protein DC041_0009358, partial [Schistosoma bovis]